MKLRAAGTLGVWLLASTALVAADFWEEKDFTAWTDEEVEKMLTDSPWSRTVSVLSADFNLAGRVGGLSGGIVGRGVGSRGGVGAAGGGVGGEGAGNLGGGSFMAPPRRTQLAVRWASALPVKKATVRGRVGDDAAIPADAQQILEQDEPFYRVAVVGVPLEFAQAVGSLRELRDATILKRKNLNPIRPVDIRLMYDEAVLTLEFHFPRTDSIMIDDREVEFITELGGARVRTTFKLENMMFGERLTL